MVAGAALNVNNFRRQCGESRHVYRRLRRSARQPGADDVGLRGRGEMFLHIDEMKRLVRHRPMDYSCQRVHGSRSYVTSAGLAEWRREAHGTKQ